MLDAVIIINPYAILENAPLAANLRRFLYLEGAQFNYQQVSCSAFPIQLIDTIRVHKRLLSHTLFCKITQAQGKQ
jgi:hypothetical protein